MGKISHNFVKKSFWTKVRNKQKMTKNVPENEETMKEHEEKCERIWKNVETTTTLETKTVRWKLSQNCAEMVKISKVGQNFHFAFIMSKLLLSHGKIGVSLSAGNFWFPRKKMHLTHVRDFQFCMQSLKLLSHK